MSAKTIIRHGQEIGVGSYSSVHRWLDRHFGKSGTCERCGESPLRPSDGKPATAWALRPGFAYAKDRSHFEELCYRCHARQDRTPECSNGHKRTPENTYTYSDGTITCRACRRETYRRFLERNPGYQRNRQKNRSLCNSRATQGA